MQRIEQKLWRSPIGFQPTIRSLAKRSARRGSFRPAAWRSGMLLIGRTARSVLGPGRLIKDGARSPSL